jgi:hypothetical protein
MKSKPYMKDLKGRQASPMMDPPERPRVRPNPRGGPPIQVGRPGLGDYAQEGEPHQRYWQVLKHNIAMPPQMAVIQPPVPVPTEVKISNQDLARAICECMACTVIQTKSPNWVEPPSSALMIDQSTTADGIPIPAGAPGAFTEVLRVVAPDRWYLVLSHFGNALEDDVAFQNVDWQIRINDRALPFQQYLGGGTILGGIFSAQLGHPENPTKLAMPIIAKYGDVVRLFARSNNGAPHTAFARFMGWMYPISMIDGAGDACSPTGMIPLWTDGGSGTVVPIT